ncbi:nardilysin [Augochlora pura]
MITHLQRYRFHKVLQCGIKKAPSLMIMSKRHLQTPPKKKLKTVTASINSTSNVTISDRHNLNNTSTTPFDIMETENHNEDSSHGATTMSPVKVTYLDVPVKSENDKKDYRVIQLENGLIALLISDMHTPESQDCSSKVKVNAIPSDSEGEEDEDDEDSEEDEDDDDSEEDEETNCEGDEDDENTGDEHSEDNGSDKKDSSTHKKRLKREEKMAACGLSVGVGSFSDPPEIPGLAHFLEHMVFMGSKKYPEEDDFDAFIMKRGGMDNASTNCEITTFYFATQEKYLLSALDRFAQFFIEPLMKKDTINKEREIVESEFKMALPVDLYRKEQMFCSFAKPGHPAMKFMWGNLITLRDNVDDEKLYEELHKFRERHYSAHRMKLAVQAKLPLDVLEDYVKQCFSNIPNNGLPPTDFTPFKGVNSFDTSSFRRMYKIKPVKNMCQVDLTWVMPSLQDMYKSKPHEYVLYVIGHKGKGSLMSYLKKKMWCVNICSDVEEIGFEHNSMYLLATLSLKLTEQGLEHLQEVLNAVFSYINMVRKEGPQKRMYDEIHKIREMTFRYEDEALPANNVEDLCENMHYYPPQDYITGNYLYFEYNPEAIQACMNYLTPDDVNIIIFDKKLNEEELKKTEPWFKTRYMDTEIPEEWVKCWRTIEPYPEFHLALPNIFLIDDFSLIPMPAEIPKYPTKIYTDELTEVWYRPDPRFRMPECYMNFYIITPAETFTPKSVVMMDLFVTTLRQLMTEQLYPALVVNLNYEIYTDDKGIVVKVGGFNQKVPLVLFTIARYIAEYSQLITEEFFNVMKKEVIKGYYNKFLRPNKLADDVRLSILLRVHWPMNVRHMAISEVEFEEFKQFAEHLTDHIYIQSLVQGNMTKDDVIKNVNNFVGILKCGPLLPNTKPQIRVNQIPVGSHCCKIRNFNKTDVNSVVTNYYQSGVASMELSIIIELFIMIMEELMFHRLRTEEQLGYNVFCLVRDTSGIYGYSITVCSQADKYSTEHVDGRIENFLKIFKKILDDTTASKEFETVKETLTKQKQSADISLEEEFDRNWTEIASGDYMFDRIERQIVVTENIKIEQLREWINRHMSDGNNFRKLSVHVVGTSKTERESNGIVDTCDRKENADSEMEKTEETKYPFSYILRSECENDTCSINYITDIEEYKSRLYSYPIQHGVL